MIKRDSVSKSCDVYSYGIFLWELVTQQQPFSDVRPQFLVMNQVLEGKVGNYLFRLNTFLILATPHSGIIAPPPSPPKLAHLFSLVLVLLM